MRHALPGLLACALMLAGCASAGAGSGAAPGQQGCVHVTADEKAAVFFVTPAGRAVGCGYTYTGAPAGRSLAYQRCIEACSVPWPSPDGHYALTEFTVTDTASGRVAARLPDNAAYVRASDSRHLCGMLGGPAVPVVLVVAGFTGRPEQVTLAPLFTRVRYSGIDLLACDPRHARAVLQARYQHVTAIAVVSLSDGAIHAEHDFPDTGRVSPAPGTPLVTAVVASADGRYLAVLHAIQPEYSSLTPGSAPAGVTQSGQPATTAAAPAGPGLPVPAYVDVLDAAHPARPVARLAGTQAAAFSDDGSLLAEQLPQAGGGTVTRVVRWSDGQVIWQGSGTLAGAASSPGVPAIAIQAYRPGWSSDQIVLVRPDGRAITVVAGQLAGP
jgi:hypothetical protein